MKKIIAIIVGISLCLAAIAQQQHARKHEKGNIKVNKEEFVEKRCKAIAEKLMLDEAVSAKFIPLYKAYLNEMGENFAANRLQNNAEVSDADIDQSVKANIEKSRKMIDIREKYYNEFRGFLTAKQAKIALMIHDRGMKMRKGENGEKGTKRNLRNETNDEKKEMLKKRLDFSHDKKKLNDSQTKRVEN